MLPMASTVLLATGFYGDSIFKRLTGAETASEPVPYVMSLAFFLHGWMILTSHLLARNKTICIKSKHIDFSPETAFFSALVQQRKIGFWDDISAQQGFRAAVKGYGGGPRRIGWTRQRKDKFSMLVSPLKLCGFGGSLGG